MRAVPKAILGGCLGGACLASVATVVFLADDARRDRVDRQLRVWRLSARRALHFAAMKVQGTAASEERRARLEQQFAIRTAEDVARVLGGMKGAIMKAGQMMSFLAEGLPTEAREAIATLQADVPPMAPSLAESVVREDLGADPESLFLDWDPMPVAAASIGQVHRAVMPDGRLVAVKVQYPGVDRAIKSDLDNAEFFYGLFASFALKNLDVKALVDELRARMADELDYVREAAFQAEFAEYYRGHPFIHVPEVVPERSGQRVLTSTWVDGWNWSEFLAIATPRQRGLAAEALFRFAQGSIHRGIFNGDPHPGNYRFHADGSVTFLDFGLVKRWVPGELEALTSILERVLDGDVPGTVDALIFAGFLPANHGLDPKRVYDYISAPYVPFQLPQFTFTPEFVRRTIQHMIDLTGEYGDVIRSLSLPTSYVLLDRVMLGLAGLLGTLEATGAWRAILDEYRGGSPATTELGRLEAAWRQSRTTVGH